MKILYTDVKPPQAKEAQAVLQTLSAEPVFSGDDEGAMLAEVMDADFLVCRRAIVGRKVIQGGRGLKLIQKAGVRAENVDLAAARTAGVPVSTLVLTGSISIAEHVLMVMLALQRRLLEAHSGVAAAKYESMGLEPRATSAHVIAHNWLGIDGVSRIRGKTVGILGLGDIGTEVARISRCLGLKLLYYRRNRMQEGEERTLGVRYAGMTDLLRESDFVVLALTLTPETTNIIGEKELAMMKNTAFLINIARGGHVDDDALASALAAGKIAGAAIDVFKTEPVPRQSRLLQAPHMVLTPHLASGNERGGVNEEDHLGILENIARVARGEPPCDVVT